MLENGSFLGPEFTKLHLAGGAYSAPPDP